MGKMPNQEERIKRYADMIRRQTGRAVRPFRADGYVNMMTRYGTSKDASEQYRFVPEESIPDELLTMYYEGNGLFAKIIDTPAEEAIKHGFTLDDISDQEVQDFYTGALDELDWEETAMTAIKWARLFGGSIAVMLINDGRGLEEPLDWRNIRSIDDIRVYERAVVQPDYQSMFNYDPQDPFRTRGSRLGMPEFYHVTSRYGSFTVHDSRCLVFQNGILPENATNSVYQLWGIPEYVRLNKAIRDAELAHRSAPKLLERSVQPVYKMKDLAALLSTDEGEDQVLRRMQVVDMARGMLSSLVIDSEGEDYDFKTFQFSGVNDVVNASCNLLSAISNIPQTILFGRSPAGMNSTGESDLENYYNYVERIDKRMVKPNLRYLLSVVFQAGLATGEIDEMPKIKVKFNPLWSVSDTEQADLDLKRAQLQQTKAQTAQVYVDMQAIDPSEVRKKLADSDEFDVENMLDEYDEEDLFAGMEEQMGQEVPQDTTGQISEEGSFSGNGEGAGQGSDAGPVEQGNSPEAAPAATKLPQDMTEEEQSEAKKDSRYDNCAKDAWCLWYEENFEEFADDDEEKAFHELVKSSKEIQSLDDTEECVRAIEELYRAWMKKRRTDAYKRIGEKYRRRRRDAKGDIDASVGVIVVKDGKILCGVRAEGADTGLICGPGGHVKDGESYTQAAFRETEEEFGISPKSLIPIGFGPAEPDTGLAPAIYLCTEYEGEPYSNDHEMQTPRFCSMEELEAKEGVLFQPFKDGIDVMLHGLKGECSANPNIFEKPIDKSAKSVTIKLQESHEDGGPGSGNHGHNGIPGQAGGSAPKGGKELGRCKFPRFEGKIEITSDVKVKLNKGACTLKKGTVISGVEDFAGKGCKRGIDVESYLVEQIGGKSGEWTKAKGSAKVVLPNGKEREAELHWFEHPAEGQARMKVKFLKGGGKN